MKPAGQALAKSTTLKRKSFFIRKDDPGKKTMKVSDMPEPEHEEPQKKVTAKMLTESQEEEDSEVLTSGPPSPK